MPPQEEQPQLAHPKYRPDIDGLRAIAVLSVVGFHAFPAWVKGGFIGVDIFFVISGYLISTIIFGSLAGEGFSYAEFYARRIRRIFPALLVVMAATFVFGWYVLLADEFRQLGKHLLASAGFVVNLVLWGEAGYFDTVAETKPLLHLWSLAVEEQFYIVWPVLLGLAWRFGGGKGRSMLAWMWAVTLLSFLINVLGVHRHATATFYSPLPRMWELAAGALLAWDALRREPHRNVFRRELRSVSGLVLIGLGLVLISKGKAFPGFWGLLPVLGACLCISAGPGAWLNRHLLGSPPMVWVGLISYPLYLWHWPLLAFARILEGGEATRETRIAAVILSIALAWLTYRFVELGLRRRRGGAVVQGLASGMVALTVVGLVLYGRVLPPRNNDPTVQAIVAANADWAYPDGLKEVAVKGETLYRIGEGKERVLLLGDSHVEQFGPRAVELDRVAPEALKTLYFGTRGACPPVPQLFEDRDPGCGPRREQLLKFAFSADIDTVILGGCWTCYFDIGETTPGSSAPPPPDHYYFLDVQGRHLLRGGDGVARSMTSLETLIKLLRTAGKKVYLILNPPLSASFEPRLLIHGSRLGTMTASTMPLSAPFPPAQKRLQEQMRQLAERAGAIVLDPAPAVCVSDQQCMRSGAGGDPVYKDGAHLRAGFVRDGATFLDPAITVSR
ncbi:acyltransferase family protein [Variovorax soli]|uniref:Peptidoglycan/LPS O-acetylase OafA/YrhL n=1 Tax=Variovorax soli TaxID=376815 RepID=A0ABU1NBZ4_9BURK|nr:acyltransferase family protein [Variovorax soli]MDR6535973.1 peptidoglycan/LPS O-acetylase OafA/YrhL [Variovorax soli]